MSAIPLKDIFTGHINLSLLSHGWLDAMPEKGNYGLNFYIRDGLEEEKHLPAGTWMGKLNHVGLLFLSRIDR